MYRGMYDYGLVNDGDSVVMGLSGGIDSLVMLDGLAHLQKIAPIAFSLKAIHVIVKDIETESNTGDLASFCQQRTVPFEVIETKFDEPPKGKEKDTCFLCSWNRRKMLFQYCDTHHIDKLALGHHQDDILETLLMNMVFHGEISTMPPLMKMQKANYDIIRPLCGVFKKDIERFAQAMDIKPIEKTCPHEKKNNRAYFRELLEQVSTQFPMAKRNIFLSMNNINEEYLPQKKKHF